MPLCFYTMRMALMQFHKWINKLLLVMKSWKLKKISFNASIALQTGVNRHPKLRQRAREREREKDEKTKAILIFINGIRKTFELLIIVSIGFISRNSTIITTEKKPFIHSGFILVETWRIRMTSIICCCTKAFLIKSLKISSWMKNCLRMERSNRNK